MKAEQWVRLPRRGPFYDTYPSRAPPDPHTLWVRPMTTITRAKAMRLFDDLPREVRDVLNYGNHTALVEQIPQLLQLVETYGTHDVVRFLRDANARLSTGSNLP